MFPLTAEMLREVKQVLEHNDAQSGHNRRVGMGPVIEMLQGMGWKGLSKKNLCDAVRAALGREWTK